MIQCAFLIAPLIEASWRTESAIQSSTTLNAGTIWAIAARIHAWMGKNSSVRVMAMTVNPALKVCPSEARSMAEKVTAGTSTLEAVDYLLCAIGSSVGIAIPISSARITISSALALAFTGSSVSTSSETGATETIY